jgi:hypothetical protein
LRESVLEAMNFQYSKRCGTAASGIHGNFQQDFAGGAQEPRLLRLASLRRRRAADGRSE